MARDDIQEAFSARSFARAYHRDRCAVLAAIHAEDEASRLKAYRCVKRRYTILRKDGEGWIRRNAVRPSEHAQQRVDEILEREARTVG